jgi:hypothetical protein
MVARNENEYRAPHWAALYDPRVSGSARSIIALDPQS